MILRNRKKLTSTQNGGTISPGKGNRSTGTRQGAQAGSADRTDVDALQTSSQAAKKDIPSGKETFQSPSSPGTSSPQVQTTQKSPSEACSEDKTPTGAPLAQSTKKKWKRFPFQPTKRAHQRVAVKGSIVSVSKEGRSPPETSAGKRNSVNSESMKSTRPTRLHLTPDAPSPRDGVQSTAAVDVSHISSTPKPIAQSIPFPQTLHSTPDASTPLGGAQSTAAVDVNHISSTPKPILRSVPLPQTLHSTPDASTPLGGAQSTAAVDVNHISSTPKPILRSVPLPATQTTPRVSTELRPSSTPPPQYTTSQRKTRLRNLLVRSGSLRLSNLHPKSTSEKKSELTTPKRGVSTANPTAALALAVDTVPLTTTRKQSEAVEIAQPKHLAASHRQGIQSESNDENEKDPTKEITSSPFKEDQSVREASPVREKVTDVPSVFDTPSTDDLIAPPIPGKQALLNQSQHTSNSIERSGAVGTHTASSRIEDDFGSPQIVDGSLGSSQSLQSDAESKEKDEKHSSPDTSQEDESEEEIVVRRSKRRKRSDLSTSQSRTSKISVDAKKRKVSKAPLPNLPQSWSLPNRYILSDGNTPAFRCRLQSGKTFTVYQWDTFHMSPSRFLSENALIVCADFLLRHHKIGPSQGFELMDETLLLGELFGCDKPNLSRFAVRLPRWEAIFDSKVLFIPVFKSNHWSLLALTGCSDILQVVWSKSYPGNPSPKRPVQLVAVHFDSLSSLGHKRNVPNIHLLIEKGITALWNQKQVSFSEDEWVQPDIHAIVKSSLRVMHCDVEQQEDGVSCGWRTIRHMLHIAMNDVKSSSALMQLANEKLSLEFEATTNLCLSLAEKHVKPSTSDIPTLMYPLHALVDAEKLSYFNATPADLAEKALVNVRFGIDASSSKTSSKTTAKTGKNATKNAQSVAILEVSKNVVSEMKRRGMNKKQVMRKDVCLSDKMSLEIAKYLFHYPPGTRYAECLYYTRYAYPDSFLVCLGVDVLFSQTPRIFGEFISPASSRVKRSRSVHFQMDVFKSISRTATKYYGEIARFRLQELVEHFRGIAEAVLKSCAKQALCSDGVSSGKIPNESRVENRKDKVAKRKRSQSSSVVDTENMTQVSKSAGESSEDEVRSDKDNLDLTSDLAALEDSSWDFGSSIVFQRPVHDELGKITSSVPAGDIADDIDACLRTADYVANEAIVSRIGYFEKYCKRIMQLQNRSLKVNTVKERVTSQSLATIPLAFSNNFLKLLKCEIRKLWGQEMKSEPFQASLDELLSRVMAAANQLFRRNGQVFFNILPSDQFLDDDPEKIFGVKGKPRDGESCPEKSSDSRREDETSHSDSKRDRAFFSFGLGFCTEVRLGYDEHAPLDLELLSLMLFVFKDCHSIRVEGISHLSDDECGSYFQTTPYAEHFGEVCKNRDRALDELLCPESQPWWDYGTNTIRHQIKALKLKILNRISGMISSPKMQLIANSLFFYDVPSPDESKPNTGQDVICGKSLTIFHGLGQGTEEVLWMLKVNDISIRLLQEEETFIFRSDVHSLLADFLVGKNRLPNINVLSVKAEVLCTTDVWNEVDFQVRGNQYLGLRKFDPVKLILSIHSSSTEENPHPLHGDYTHCFIGFVLDHHTPVGNSRPGRGSTVAEVERNRCIGPMYCHVDVVLHDDLFSASGIAVSIVSFVERWNATSVSKRACYVVPIDGLDLRKEASQYFALKNCGVAPHVFRLAMVDLNMAESYELERRKWHYQLLRYTTAEDPFQRHRFQPLRKLEDEHKEMIYSLIGFFDRNLSDEQRCVIQKTLYGWPSDSTPNGCRVVDHTTDEMKEYLRKSETVSSENIAWWGSNLCVLDGFPGSGKSRTIAVLICTVLQSMALPSSLYGYKGMPRVLVVTVSDSAMEDLFCTVCRFLRNAFGQNSANYRQALKKMLCISSHSVKELARSRQYSYLTAIGVPRSVMGEAKVVFTTASNLHREEMSCDIPFSLLVVDEAEFMEDESLLEAVSTAFVRYKDVDDFKRATILISGDYSSHGDPSSRLIHKCSNFFGRTRDSGRSCDLSFKASLSHHYRLSKPLRKFLEPLIFHSQKNESSREGTDSANDGLWGDDNLLKSLRNNRNSPLRNVMVIDTSLDKKHAFASSGGRASRSNKWEAFTIRHLLSQWTGDELNDSAAVQKRITVICPYAKQRIEIAMQLTNAGLSKVQVRTLDQVFGVDNDIIIISLVDTRSQPDKISREESTLFPPTENSSHWMKLACTRARQAVIVVGFGQHFCQHESAWGPFFKTCLARAQAVQDGEYGYYRPRYVVGKQDFKLASFSPLYATS